MEDKLSRREFIQIAGGGAVALAFAGGGLLGLHEYKENHLVGDPNYFIGATKIPTFCEVCFWQCGALAYVRDGKVLKIEGNPIDPLANGKLCPRGSGGLGMIYDPDRLKKPLIRYSSHSGQQKFREVTWDEALSTAADRLLAVKNQYGPEAIALFFHGKGGPWFSHLMKAIGSPNMAEPAYAQCLGPREVGFWLTFGTGFGTPEPFDLANSKALVLLGAHLGENMHNTQVQEFADAVGAGVHLIVVDPRFSTAASKANRWLPIKPGTDTALLLSWINVVINEKLYDAEYLAKYTIGLPQLKGAVAAYTPEWAEAETEIPAEIIRDSIREVAERRPHALIYPGRHVTWYGNDTQRSRAVAILNALLGSYGRPGGIYIPTKPAVPQYPTPPYPKPKRGPADGGGTVYPLGSGISTGLRIATRTEQPYPIRAWMVYATNLIYSMPNPNETIEAIHKLDTLIAIDTMPAEITGWADIVLPECTYFERYDDLRIAGGRAPFIQLRQPAVQPLYETKPGWWIAKELGNRLGLSGYFPWGDDIEGYLDKRLRGSGLSLDQMKREGSHVFPAGPIYIDDMPGYKFGTTSGKIELYSDFLAKMRLDPVPRYTPPALPPDGYVRLIYGRSPVHSFSRTQNNRLLTRIQDQNGLWISPQFAQQSGVLTGDRVWVINQDEVKSQFPIKVQVTERIRDDCAFMSHGFGHSDRRLRRAYGKGASDAALMTQYAIDPLIGSTGMRVNFVRLEKES